MSVLTRSKVAVVLVAGAAVLGVGTALTLSGAPAQAVSPDIVISQVYGAGGNSGAPYDADFVELYNRGTTSVSVASWTVQYASATGSSWSRTTLTGSIAAGHHYLVEEAAGSTGAALPAPDATGSIALSGTAGKVALVTSGTALTCSTGCSTATGVRDFLGYGSTASSAEGSPTANLSTTTAAIRNGGGGTDTDHNSADFTLAAPAPKNSSYGQGAGGGTRIHDIQGAAHISPLNGKAVTAVPGIVTAEDSTGFWMQDPTPDTNVATSEGIFVYTAGAPTTAVGDSVTVNATVSEFRPGGTGGTTNLTTTELVSPTVTIVSHGNPLPAATVVGPGGRVPPSALIDNESSGDVETRTTFNATADGIDFWESMEGMRVELDNPAVVGPTDSYGELYVVPTGSGTRTNRGGIVAQATDFNPERVMVSSTLATVPAANVGDTLSGAVVGPLDYDFGDFTVLATTAPTVTSGGIQPETTTAPTSSQLEIATFNVENLAPSDPASKFSGLASALVNNLKAPDLVALEEIQDNDGATDDGVVSATTTMSKLIAAISAAGGPTYKYSEIDPVNDQDGGEPGGNIRQVFLYRTDRGLAFTARSGGTSTNSDSVVNTGGVPSLKYSPGRIDPTNSAWNASRKPLAGEFTWKGHTVFVIANHFDAKLGDSPLFGHVQPPTTPSVTQRVQQATEVKNFVASIRAVNANADVVVLGDLNDFDFSSAVSALTSGGNLVDLPATLPLAERYTYVYEGNSEVLDHILLSPALAGLSYAYDVVHINSEFSTQLSDHDPQVVRLPLS